MLVDYLERGVLAGAIAGIVYGTYMAVVANPLIGYMETVAAGGDHAHEAGEHAHEAGEHAHAAGEHAHAVSEATTAAVSVGSGVLWGILLGGAFALAFYFLEPALPGRGRVKTYVLAGAGFLTVSVAPWLVLPPTTPGAEQAFDPTLRIAIYAGLMAVGALVAALSIYGYRRVSARSRQLGGVAAAIPIVALVAVTAIAAPTIVESGSMPAELVTAFRGLTALSQAALWAFVAGCFGWLQTRAGVHSTAERRDDLLTSP
ncbi:CbtA family protein [Natrinema versiforme]|uniref:Cobalamin cluster protein n=1 Tax=Natrinema versiforme TaxID=88724 RepID=A0A4P8WJP4_9EURY|nr:CbtA family protein [Natrinema versiforme]QCS42141.1 cobalamin cluster protein [Natrinema versiforme]